MIGNRTHISNMILAYSVITLLTWVCHQDCVMSQILIGNDLILRKEEYDSEQQTIVDRNSVFTEDGFVTGWQFYSKWQEWEDFSEPMHISLEVWACSDSMVCDVTPRHITHLVLDQTLGDTVVEVPLPTPLPVSAGDCLGYSTRGNKGMIPYDDKISGGATVCHINISSNDKSEIPFRQYSYQALFVKDYTEPSESLITGQYHNTNHQISGDGQNVQTHHTQSRFTCAGFCTRTNSMSFSYSQATRECVCSEDNAFPYTVVTSRE